MNAPSAPPRRDLYPVLEPFQSEMLRVSPLHNIYFEQCGDPRGRPALALHGGPGGGLSPEMRRFFDPARYRVVLMDQRGCGRSTPHAEVRENSTWELVADIERVRERLGIDKWLVFGGSWGSTLALAYAVTHPDRVAGSDPARRVSAHPSTRSIGSTRMAQATCFPTRSTAMSDAHSRKPNAATWSTAFYSTSDSRSDRATRASEAARAWARWEGETISIAGPSALPSRFNEDRFVEAFARIECHYFVNRGFFERDGWLLEQAPRYRAIPGRIVHGRYDMCTPLASAWSLKRAWPEADLEIIHDAGHSSLEPGIVDALVRATDAMLDKVLW